MAEQVPIADLAAYYSTGPHSSEAQRAIQAVHVAASTWGFFIITGTDVSPPTQSSLLSVSRDFFDLPLDVKTVLDVRNGGVAWRGYMPLGGECTTIEGIELVLNRSQLRPGDPDFVSLASVQDAQKNSEADDPPWTIHYQEGASALGLLHDLFCSFLGPKRCLR